MTTQSISRILHVVATLSRGGTEVACLGLVKGLAELGVENRVVAVAPGDRAISEAFEPLCGTPDVLPAGRNNRMRAFTGLVKAHQPDAIIFHFFTIEHVLLSLAAKLVGVRPLACVQGNPAPTDPSVKRKVSLILRATRAVGVGVISASAFIERTMQEVGALPRHARVIHNGCDVNQIAERAAAARTNTPSDEARILMIARLDSIKDHRTLISAIAQLPAQINDRRVLLQLAGDGALRDTLELHAAESGVKDRVRFLGARRDIPELLGQAAVFCLSTTRDEGFGVVLIEALAAGTPVVASDVPACREVLKDGALGTLVSAAEASALAHALEQVLTQDDSTSAVDLAYTHYDVSAMAKAYLDFMNTLSSSR